jgi:hypothetical protein
MSPRDAARSLRAGVAWGLAAAAVLVLAAAVVLKAQQPALEVSDLLYGSALLSFALVGAFVARRRPDNAVGWLFAAVGLVGLLQFASYQAAFAAYGPSGLAVPGAVWFGWFSSWVFPAVAGIFLVIIPLLFPDGHLPSRRSRWIVVGTMATVALASLAGMLRPGPFDDLVATPDNPLGVASAFWLSAVQELGMLAIGLLALATIAAIVGRYRRSGQLERLQLKWFAYAFALVVAYVLFSMVGEGILGREPPPVVHTLAPLLLAGIPASAAVAILRFRLYEIDRIVSRTVSYALVTSVLVGVYAGGVLLLGRLLAPMTRQSEVAVAASTLLVAALFQPVRRRVQSAVDRRFNRARYDAQRTVEDFAAGLRHEVHLDDVRERLLAAVGATVAPGLASVWLRPERQS